MTASLHNTLILMVNQVVQGLPAPLRRALDAWSLRVARRRALERQRKWARRQAGAAAQATIAPGQVPLP